MYVEWVNGKFLRCESGKAFLNQLNFRTKVLVLQGLGRANNGWMVWYKGKSKKTKNKSAAAGEWAALSNTWLEDATLTIPDESGLVRVL